MTPLFIPLKGEYFDAFADGSKNTEYRAHGRCWNAETCRPGREVILSRGYGKARRLRGVITSFSVHYAPHELPGWLDVYPDAPPEAACIQIQLLPRRS